MANVELVDSIDLDWLEREARKEPVVHAYPLWDLLTMPDRTRFVSIRRDGRTLGYLIIWLGNPEEPILHWVGPAEETLPLAERLPPRPLVAVVAEDIAPAVVAKRGPSSATVPLVHMLRRRDLPAALASKPRVRRLRNDDRAGVVDLVSAASIPGAGFDPLLEGYRTLDFDQIASWAAFDSDGRVLGVARNTVRLPHVWVVSGVYVRPDARNQGLAKGIVAAFIQEATKAGADSALFCREENAPARRAYEHLGFEVTARRLWMGLGARVAPLPP